MLNEAALAREIKSQTEELHEIADALLTTNALRAKRIHQIAGNLESYADILTGDSNGQA